MGDFSFILQDKPTASKVFNINNTHPLIQSSQEYSLYKQYVSIHSEDRDVLKYPNSNSFEIEMPEDLLNVFTVKLANWSFPSNYNTFSTINSNVTMTFKINKPQNPSDIGSTNALYNAIFTSLFLSKDTDYTIIIESGFYNPNQMVTELTNKFNYVVTQKINAFLLDSTGPYYDPLTYPGLYNDFQSIGGYTNFSIVYNTVSQKIWFGNNADGFILTNETQVNKNKLPENIYCTNKTQMADFSNWGLPANLGLPRNNVNSINGLNVITSDSASVTNNIITPRFFYGDVYPGDNGYWLLPNASLPGCQVNWVECAFKINLMGPAYLYMEIEGLNCIDETSPYNVSPFTTKTNETNGVVNSSFAKIAIPTTPNSQWFDRDSLPYKQYLPPAERIRRLRVKLRYHNDQLVDFGVSDYSFMLEFTMLTPQPSRNFKSSYGTTITNKLS